MGYGNYCSEVVRSGVDCKKYSLRMLVRVDDKVRDLLGSISFLSTYEDGCFIHPTKAGLKEVDKLSELEDFVLMIWGGVEERQKESFSWIVGRSVSVTHNYKKLIDMSFS